MDEKSKQGNFNNKSDRLNEVRLQVNESRKNDVGRSIVRLNSRSMEIIGVSKGNIIEIIGNGNKSSAAIAWPSYPQDQGKGIVSMDTRLRNNIGVEIEDVVIVKKANTKVAKKVVLTAQNVILNPNAKFVSFVKRKLHSFPVTIEDLIGISKGISKELLFTVTSLKPEDEICIIKNSTLLIIENRPGQPSNQEFDKRTEIKNNKMKIKKPSFKEDYKSFAEQETKKLEEYNNKSVQKIIRRYAELIPNGVPKSDPNEISMIFFKTGNERIMAGEWAIAELLLKEAVKACEFLGNWLGVVSAVGSLVLCKINEIFFDEIRKWNKRNLPSIKDKRIKEKYYRKHFELSDKWLDMILSKNDYKCPLTYKKLEKNDVIYIKYKIPPMNVYLASQKTLMRIKGRDKQIAEAIKSIMIELGLIFVISEAAHEMSAHMFRNIDSPEDEGFIFKRRY